MDVSADIIRTVWNLIKFLFRLLFKPVMKILIFTGLLFPIILAIFQLPAADPFPGYIWAIAWLLCLYRFTQNIIRTITKDRSFSFIKLIFGQRQIHRERAATNPAAAKELKTYRPQGFIFGKKGADYIAKPETLDGHILAVGGAGSGKSSCLAIPSLLSWGSRVFAIDIKGELYEETKYKRPNIKVFNPILSNSPGYNPYYLLSGSRNPSQDAREIALALMPTPPDVKDPFWIESSQNIFTGSILHFHGIRYSFTDTITAIQSTPIEQLVTEIYNSTTVEARYFVNQLIGLEQKTLAGIATELSNKIMVFATDPDIKSCFSKIDVITPHDLETGADIYINIPEYRLEQWRGIFTLIINQFLKHFERRPDMTSTPILFLLDEAARLGKVSAILDGLATLRSKKITICLLTQSLAQLDMIYGREARQVISDNCQFKAILSATDADTQEYFSRLIGTYEKQKKSQNASFEQFTGFGKGTGESRTTEEKRIIRPEQLATLPDIILLTPYGFCRVDKAPYYKDKSFLS